METAYILDHSTQNVEAAKFAVIVNLPVNRTTLPTLMETVDFVSGKSFARIELDCGNAEEIDGALLGAIKKSIEISVENGTWPSTLGLPLCALPEFEEHAGELYLLEPHIPGYGKIPGICFKCEVNNVCRGVPENQLDKFDLKPIENMPATGKIEDLKNIYARLDREK